MIRKCRRLLPTLIFCMMCLVALRHLCLFPSCRTNTITITTSTTMGMASSKTPIEAVGKIVPKEEKPIVKEKVKDIPVHEHEKGPTFNPAIVNPFSLFDHYPLNLDMNLLVSQLKSGQKPSVKPLNRHPFKFVIPSKHKCKRNESIFMVLLVKTRPESFEIRQAIRATWGNEKSVKDAEIRTLFLLGLPKNSPLQHQLLSEQQEYGDLLQEDFVDNYYNNTIKLMMGLKWVTTFCQEANFIVFADDDMMIIPRNLVSCLSSKEIRDLDRLYMGYVPLHPAPVRDLKDKWGLPPKDYPFERFPNYVTTGTLLMNMAFAQDFYLAMQYIKQIPFDDVYIGIVAKKLGVQPIHNDYMYPARKNYSEEVYEHLIATHGGFKAHEIKGIWDQILQKSQKS